MDAVRFLDWLTTEKNMGTRSAKDVLSRCGRVSRMLNIEEIEEQFANDVDSVKRERDENTYEVAQKIPKIDNEEMNSA